MKASFSLSRQVPLASEALGEPSTCGRSSSAERVKVRNGTNGKNWPIQTGFVNLVPYYNKSMLCWANYPFLAEGVLPYWKASQTLNKVEKNLIFFCKKNLNITLDCAGSISSRIFFDEFVFFISWSTSDIHWLIENPNYWAYYCQLCLSGRNQTECVKDPHNCMFTCFILLWHIIEIPLYI